jgi:pimeloyl-ACP methyl ester carboxylesterase
MTGLTVRDLTQWMIPRMTMAGCHITDIQRTLGRITSTDSWPEEWGRTAEQYLALGADAERAGHRHTAHEMYFYAMLYLYEGQKTLFEESERKRRLFSRMVEVYRKVVEHCPYPIERVEVPYQAGTLPAYLHKPLGLSRFPCLLFIQGMDSSKEEWHRWGRYASERGFALLCVDTPGHGETRHFGRMLLDIPELVAAASACRRYLAGRADVVPDRIGVLGNCLGSNYGFQAAAYDHDFACCLIILAIAEFKNKTGDWDVPKWFFDMIRFFTGDSTGTPGAFAKYRTDFALDRANRKVTCPTRIFQPTEDNWVDWAQAELMAKYVDGPVTLTPVKGEPVFSGTAMSHLVPIYEQIHWVLPVAFDWVAEQLGTRR